MGFSFPLTESAKKLPGQNYHNIRYIYEYIITYTGDIGTRVTLIIDNYTYCRPYGMYERPAGIENSRIWIDGCFDFAHHGMYFTAAIAGL